MMKKIMSLAVVAGLLMGSVAATAGVPKTKADHLAVAEKYEKLAAEQEAIVKEHTQMKQDYNTNQAVLPKQTREKSLAEMDQHCDALIQAAKKEADEYRAIAQWHKVRATEAGN